MLLCWRQQIFSSSFSRINYREDFESKEEEDEYTQSDNSKSESNKDTNGKNAIYDNEFSDIVTWLYFFIRTIYLFFVMAIFYICTIVCHLHTTHTPDY